MPDGANSPDKLTTRREFLQNFGRTFKGIIPNKSGVEQTPTILISRRDTLKFLGALGFSIAFSELLPKNVLAVSPIKDVDPRQEKKVLTADAAVKKWLGTSYFESIAARSALGLVQMGGLSLAEKLSKRLNFKKSSYSDIAIKASLLMTSELIGVEVLDALGMSQPLTRTNASAEQIAQGDPVETLIDGVIISPLIETTIFQALPSYLATKISGSQDKTVWKVGIPSAALFALVHNIPGSENSQNIPSLIPLPQFISGLFFWKLIRDGNFNKAAFGHSAFNASAIGLGEFLSYAIPQKK